LFSKTYKKAKHTKSKTYKKAKHTKNKNIQHSNMAASSMPFNIQDPYWNNVHPGMPSRIKHRLILVRHGESESNIELTTTGQTSEFTSIPHKVGGRGDIPLTARGKEQAQDVADFLALKGINHIDGHIDQIYISPLWRTIQTALPTLEKKPYNDIEYPHEVRWPSKSEMAREPFYVGINYDLREKYSKEAYWVTMPRLSSYFQCYRQINFHKMQQQFSYNYAEHQWLRQPETTEEFCRRTSSVMDEWKKEGNVENRKQTIVFTHSQFISQLLAGDSKMSFHLANGSISIIDIDEENNLHVQVANYTKHLQTPTGMHTCIY
jgi:broad specificity phosphatase PhoE